jgi:hypothetical protein
MAGNQHRRDVSGNRADGYKVTSHGKTTAEAPTQGSAEVKAEAQVDKAGGGQVYIHRTNNGQIRDADTVAPGNESRAKDTRH